MNINNYDMSSSGPNLDLTAFYDTISASIEFEDNFKVLQYASRREASVLIYTDFGNLPKHWEMEYTLKGDVKEIVEWLCNAYSNSAKDFLHELHEWLGVKSLRNVTVDDLDFILPDIADLFSDSVKDFLDNILPDRLWSSNYTQMVVTGYSQGDITTVIIPNCLHDIAGLQVGAELLSCKRAKNLIYDCPWSVNLVINGSVFRFEEHTLDRYQWDKDNALKSFEVHYKGDNKEYIYNWLSDNLPTDLNFV